MNQLTAYTYEVIVVDGGSEGIELLKKEQKWNNVKWLYTDTANPYTSRNIGIKASQGKVIGLLDAKSIPRSDWIDQALKSMCAEGDADDRVIVAGAYEVTSKSNELKEQAYGILYLNNNKNVAKGYGVTTGNLWAPKSAFVDLGYFTDQYVSGNDILWTKGAIKEGYKILYAEQVVVSYEGQSYDDLKTSAHKYFTGIAIQHKNQKKSLLSSLSYTLRQLLPMRFSNFHESLDYRGLSDISWRDKAYLWFVIWRLKIHMALIYMKRSIGL